MVSQKCFTSWLMPYNTLKSNLVELEEMQSSPPPRSSDCIQYGKGVVYCKTAILSGNVSLSVALYTQQYTVPKKHAIINCVWFGSFTKITWPLCAFGVGCEL